MGASTPMRHLATVWADVRDWLIGQEAAELERLRARCRRDCPTMAEPTCSDCRWWIELDPTSILGGYPAWQNSQQGWRRCTRVSSPSALAEPSAAADEGSALMTAPDFGCNQWEGSL